MIMSEIKHYLASHRILPLHDIALHFNMEEDAMRGILDKWRQKGRLKKITGAGGCRKGCCRCDPAAIEIYQWLG
jgi:hypothetical protein